VVLATNRPGDLDSAILDRMDEALEFGLPGVSERQQILSLYLDQYIFKAGTVEGGAGAASSRGLWQRFSVSHYPPATSPPLPLYKRPLISKAYQRPCNSVKESEAAVDVNSTRSESQLLKRRELMCNRAHYVQLHCLLCLTKSVPVQLAKVPSPKLSTGTARLPQYLQMHTHSVVAAGSSMSCCQLIQSMHQNFCISAVLLRSCFLGYAVHVARAQFKPRSDPGRNFHSRDAARSSTKD